ncbi:MAG: DNA-3-methyladenine glycosylase I [Desulfobacterales bacterium]|nr:DNA-3-methyladenine glycosylase I [Desulfobacterales bacterium]
MAKEKKRCIWAGSDPLYVDYHDQEWGVPLHDDIKLFEFLILEGAQAGLNWITILRKRGNYKNLFDNFNPEIIANYNNKKIDRLMENAGIIRNRLKIQSAVQNARSFLKVRQEFGCFDKYIWQFVDGEPVTNKWKTLEHIPAKTDISIAMSKDLKKRGFNFTGPTICYAFMQAVGMVNDHTTDCFRHHEVKKISAQS